MRIRFIHALGLAVAVFSASAYSQVVPSATPCLTTEDAKQVRQLIADKEFYKQEAENAKRERDEAIGSRDRWKGLYESEKKRADEIQGQRIDNFKDQAVADRQKIGEQNARIIKLESSRKWYFILGSAAGAAAGYYIGQNQDRIINTITPANRPANFKLRF